MSSNKRFHRIIEDEEEENCNLTEKISNIAQWGAHNEIDNSEHLKNVFQFIFAGTSSKGFVRDAEVRKVFGNASKEVRDSVIQTVTEKFDSIFGLKLVHDTDNSRFYLGSNLRLPNIKFTKVDVNETIELKDSNEDLKDGLLISALMFIFMTKKHVMDDEPGVKLDILRSYLQKINDIPNDLFTSLFGPVKTAYFLSHDWLKCTIQRNPNSDETIFYDWGPHAEAVVNKRELLLSYCSIYGTQPSDWPHHLLKAGIN